jgi:hypothetical protein
VLFAEDAQKLRPSLGERFDLGSDVVDGSHVSFNVFAVPGIPVCSGRQGCPLVVLAQRLDRFDEGARG